jgi:hypothetical protein
MVVPNAPENPNSKITIASRKIAEIFKETADKKGTQLVFLDMGTPKAKDKVDDTAKPDEDEETGEEQALLKNVYGNLKGQLIAEGIPDNQIAFIHDAKGDKQKLAMIDKVNNGEIRVLIGSTSKLGVGVNVQKRAAALHHLDCPWKPRDIEQREGRVIRQGNNAFGPKFDDKRNIIDPGPGVKVYSYVTERSFDAFMWQAVEAKAKAIKAIMRRSAPPRAVEDVDNLTMSASEAKAIASGNPDVLKAVTLKNNVSKLQMLRSSYINSKTRANEQIRAIPGQIESLKSNIGKMEKDASLVKDEGKFSLKVKGIDYDEHADAGEALVTAMKNGEYNADIGEYRGFKVRVIDQGPQTGFKLIAVNPDTGLENMTTAIPHGELTGNGVISRLDNRIKVINYDLEKSKRQLEEAERNLNAYKTQAGKPFEYQEQLDRMEKELNRINRKLQGEKVEDTPSDNYMDSDIDVEESYHYGERNDEQLSPKAEIEAVRAEVAPVEKALEVKPPAANIEQIVDKMDEPVKKNEDEKPKDALKMSESKSSDGPGDKGTTNEAETSDSNIPKVEYLEDNKNETDEVYPIKEIKETKPKPRKKASKRESKDISTEETSNLALPQHAPYGLKELRERNANRRPQAIARDNKAQHQVTVDHTNPVVRKWINHPGSMDVLGVDNPPNITQPTKPISETKKSLNRKSRSLDRKASIRITPRRKKLK